MDDEEYAPPSLNSRRMSFGEGMLGGQQEFTSPSMAEYGRRYNASVPKAYRPSGALNGMSIEQYKTTMGGAFPTNNGQAMDTYQTKRYFTNR